MSLHRATWSVLGGKWKGLIWWRLSAGLVRFGELRRAIPQATQKVLTQQLRELERDGIVARTVHPDVPPRVEYALTDYGRTLGPVIDAISDWGEEHLKRRRGASDGTDRMSLIRLATPATGTLRRTWGGDR